MVARQRRRHAMMSPARKAIRRRRRWNDVMRRPWRALALISGCIMLLLTLVDAPRPRMVWNSSLSSPVGLYAVGDQQGLRPGDMVVANLPPTVKDLAAGRRYLPVNVPVVKQVAAAGGDLVCARGRHVSVNGRTLAERLSQDRHGRPLPSWFGCRRLARGQLFLLSAGVRDAFDGRYFGVTERREVIGRARHLWPFE
ncbi:S26 family signal peptidase [Sphingomonas sp. ASV193]|uniref:S26 family signal peptidase n=1 Tax=Sphingomonas sp. ASV193 TaxID=3144405 RepID=UPI0032E8635A